jgi:DNA-binding transcriptional LysR family regulator
MRDSLALRVQRSSLAEFTRGHSQVVVHLQAINRRVDLVSDAVDVAIRGRPHPWNTVFRRICAAKKRLFPSATSWYGKRR